MGNNLLVGMEMRQIANPELARYQEWLLQRRLAAEQHVGHFSRWVGRFLSLRASRPREIWHDTLTVFLEDLGDGRYKPWQLRQAADAVTLYCGQFCKEMDTPVAPKCPTDNKDETRGQAPGTPSAAGGAAGDGDGRAGGGRARSAQSRAHREPAAEPEQRGCAPAQNEGVLTHTDMLAEIRRILRLRHYAGSTERSYLGWNQRFLRYVGRSGEHVPTGEDVQAFLSHLVVQGDVSASTQNQAFHAVLFLLRHVLMVDPCDLSGTVRARQGKKLPVLLLPDETRAVLTHLKGTHRLMLELMYGAGLRLGELLKLRVKDLDFTAGTVTVRAGKGDKDRMTFLPKRLAPELGVHLEKVKAIHQRDLAAGAGDAPLPHALARKYPNAGREWGWQFVFPSTKLQVDEAGTVRRWHLAAAPVQRAMKKGGAPNEAEDLRSIIGDPPAHGCSRCPFPVPADPRVARPLRTRSESPCSG